MYQPQSFVQTDPVAIQSVMREHALATWLVSVDGEMVANHVPFLHEPGTDGRHGRLIAHVARANPVWQQIATASSSLVIFQGPQAYISPAWYPGKQEHGKVVPTWNYAVVHVRGVARAVDDPAALLDIVSRLSDTHEAAMPHPWRVADAPRDYIDRMLKAIVGIEIAITGIEAKWKVSQNHPADSREGVVAGLRRGDGAPAQPDEQAAMAALVEGTPRG